VVGFGDGGKEGGIQGQMHSFIASGLLHDFHNIVSHEQPCSLKELGCEPTGPSALFFVRPLITSSTSDLVISLRRARL